MSFAESPLVSKSRITQIVPVGCNTLRWSDLMSCTRHGAAGVHGAPGGPGAPPASPSDPVPRRAGTKREAALASPATESPSEDAHGQGSRRVEAIYSKQSEKPKT